MQNLFLVIGERNEVPNFLPHFAHCFIRRTAADISFVRARVFYARPNRDPESRRIIVGLPHSRKPLQYIRFALIEIGKMCLTGLILLISGRRDGADSLARIAIPTLVNRPRRRGT